MATTNTGLVGRDLRATRRRAGVSRAQLANLAGCSLASLANIEQGAVPRRSRVLEDAFAALAVINDPSTSEGPASHGTSAKTAGVGGRHGTA